MIINLGHRADSRARGSHRIGLIDGNRRRNAFDAIDSGFIHAIQKLARVGRKCFDVTTLSLGVQSVEHQRGLSGTRYARDDHQLAERNIDTEVLEIVLPSAANDDVLSLGFVHGIEC